jgi:hypothetical protein
MISVCRALLFCHVLTGQWYMSLLGGVWRRVFCWGPTAEYWLFGRGPWRSVWCSCGLPLTRVRAALPSTVLRTYEQT